MEIDADKLMEHAIRVGLQEGIKSRLSNVGYNNSMDRLIEDCIKKHDAEFRELLNGAIASCLSDSVFREEVRASVRSTVAKMLVQRFGGELEKQVNTLKSDPTTRARITIAIEEIVKQRTA